MSLNNDVRLIGFCASKPVIKKAANGNDMTVLSIYTRNFCGVKNSEDQLHRCFCFGEKAKLLVEKCEKGMHIYLKCELRTQKKEKKEEGGSIRYYTNIIINEYIFSPPQSIKALKDTICEIVKENNITSTDQMGIFDN